MFATRTFKIMKLFIVTVATLSYVALVFGNNLPFVSARRATLAFDGRVAEKEYVLAQNTGNVDNPGEVRFDHTRHSTKNYSIDGKGLIACVECHHTDQPKAAAAKLPPLESADPPDRTTTLTADLLATDPSAPDIKECRACHSPRGEKPRAWPEIPKVIYEGETESVTMTNEEAYHHNCNACHDQALILRPSLRIPSSQECATCHTGKR